ncbi:MAG: hypothetical protein ACTSUR_01615 [Candidatus Heimdallarchaeaceae archaeon]
MNSNAAVRIFDETFTTNDPFIFIQYRVVVWSNQHVEVYEVYVTYKYYSTDPEQCTFFYIAMTLELRYPTSYYFNKDIPQHAPGVYQTGYVSGYGDLPQNLWESGQCPLSINIQMRTISYAYLTKFAVFQLVVTNYYGLGRAFISNDYIELKSLPIFPDYTFWP